MKQKIYSKHIIYILLIFFVIFLGYLNVYQIGLENSYLIDIFFHEEIINRIKLNENISEDINTTEYNWSTKYISNYPIIYHNIVSKIPLNTKLSMGVFNSFLLSMIFLGFCLIAYLINKNILFGFIYFELWNLISKSMIFFNYTHFYLFGLVTQLMINTVFVYCIVGIIYLFKYKRKLLIPFIILSIILMVINHRVPSLKQMIMVYERFIPILLIVLIPFIHWLIGKRSERKCIC